ncbi:unnamed protein product [Lathyrus oleraceus]
MGFKLNVLLFVILATSLIAQHEVSVSYDYKAITINGQRRILLYGSIHYPRSTPEMRHRSYPKG